MDRRDQSLRSHNWSRQLLVRFSLLRWTQALLGVVALCACSTDPDVSRVAPRQYWHLDTAYADDGIALVSDGSNASAMDVEPSGAAYLAAVRGEGRSRVGTWSLVRVESSGRVDEEFRDRATRSLQEFQGEPLDVKIWSDRVLVGGIVVSNSERAAIVALRTDGSLNRSFGQSGVALLPESRSGPLALFPHEQTVVVVFGGDDGNLRIARYTEDGQLDPTFAVGGVRRTELVSADLAQDPGGRILIGGRDAARLRTTVQRLSPNGEVDRSFGIAGQTVLEDPTQELVAGDRAGGFLMYDLSNPGTVYTHRITRRTERGRIDREFGNNGTIEFSGRLSLQAFINDPSDSWLSLVSEANGVAFLSRRTRDGRPDHSFFKQGRVTVAIRGRRLTAEALGLDRRGRILVGATVDGGEHIALLRYSAM